MAACPTCGSDELEKIGDLADGRREIRSENGHRFPLGLAKQRVRPTFGTFAEAKRRFPTTEEVDPDRYARVTVLKNRFLVQNPQPQPDVGPYWAKYQQVFSADGLANCDPLDLKDFANNTVGASPGNQSTFNTAWNGLGDLEAAARTRESIRYLLYGPEEVPLEDRLTQLIVGDAGFGMTGFREALLTKVLCVVHPDRFIPILIYSSTQSAGKREIAQLVYGLTLPDASKVTWTIGRLIIWSNDVLRELAGDGFRHQQHVAQFLWETKDRSAELETS